MEFRPPRDPDKHLLKAIDDYQNPPGYIGAVDFMCIRGRMEIEEIATIAAAGDVPVVCVLGWCDHER